MEMYFIILIFIFDAFLEKNMLFPKKKKKTCSLFQGKELAFAFSTNVPKYRNVPLNTCAGWFDLPECSKSLLKVTYRIDKLYLRMKEKGCQSFQAHGLWSVLLHAGLSFAHKIF